jgi:pimeloyl-ACP methyl ester carboxylesterase
LYEALEVATEKSQSPALLHFAAEGPRVMLEAASLPFVWLSLLCEARRGDPHPVLVLPGFTASDASTLMLRRFLDQLGYRTLPWTLGANTGNANQLGRLVSRFRALAREQGEPISLIGQSLGGVYARALAREWPDAVRQVITLASPFAANQSSEVNGLVQALFESMSGDDVGAMRERLKELDLAGPLDVPTTSIYSRSDGVVGWRACIEPESKLAQNIEIVGSHTGMAMNPHVLHIIADRLAEHPDHWRRFDHDRGWRRWWLPRAAATA